MKITFNTLGVVIETDISDEPLRQGNAGANTLTATFQGKNNFNYTAVFGFTRSDGSQVTDVSMSPDLNDLSKFHYTFDDPWFFALSGETTCSVKLVNAGGQVVVSGQITFNIEKTDFSDEDPQITIDQMNDLLALIASKLNTQNGIIVIPNNEVDVSENVEGQLFFVTDKATMGFYTKNALGSLSRTYQFIGLIYRNGVISTNTTLSDAEMKEVEKQFCVMWYNPEKSLYIKTSTDSGYATFTKQIGVSNYSDYVRITIKSIVVNCNSGADYGKASLYGQNSDVPTKTYTDSELAKRVQQIEGTLQVSDIVSDYNGSVVTKIGDDIYLVGVSYYSSVYHVVIKSLTKNYVAVGVYPNDVQVNAIFSDGAATRGEQLLTNGNFSIYGKLTFYTLPQSSTTPSNANDLTRKGYVDSEVGDVDEDLQAHKNNKANPHEVTKAQVGLSNVTNHAQVKRSEMGVADGVATLDNNGKIPLDQLPDSILSQMVMGGMLCFVSTTEGQTTFNTATECVFGLNRNACRILGLSMDHHPTTINGVSVNGNMGIYSYNEVKNAIANNLDKAEGLVFIVGGDIIKFAGNINAYTSVINIALYSSPNTLPNVTTGDWLVTIGVDGNAIDFQKVDNTDAVFSVNGKTGAVTLNKTDIGLENVDNLKQYPYTSGQNLEVTKLDETDAQQKYQSKILHADLLSISSTDWVLDTSEEVQVYRYTSEDLYEILGLINADDIVELVGIGSESRKAIAELGIWLEDVSTTDGETHASICSTFEPTETLSFSVVVTKQQYYGGSITGVITVNDIDDDTIKIVSSKLQVNKDKFIEVYSIPSDTTLDTIMRTIGQEITIFCKSQYKTWSLGLYGNINVGLCNVELEDMNSPIRYYATSVSSSLTLLNIMANSAYRQDYVTEVKSSNVNSESATSGQVLTANGSGGASWQTPVGTRLYKHEITYSNYPTMKEYEFNDDGTISTRTWTPNYAAKSLTIISSKSTAFTTQDMQNAQHDILYAECAINIAGYNNVIVQKLSILVGERYSTDSNKLYKQVMTFPSGTTITDTVTEL